MNAPPADGPKRTIALVRPIDRRGVGVIRMRTGKKIEHYTFREIPCEIGGRGFALHKTGVGNLYHVRVGSPAETSCECLGFLAHGHCKHIDGLTALIRQREV